jgi:hypothetical protein
MRAFIPLLPLIALTIIGEVVGSEITTAARELRPLLMLGLVLAWLISLVFTALLFTPWLGRRCMGVWSCTLLPMVAVIIQAPLVSLSHDYSEEYVIRQRLASGADFDHARYLYYDMSGSGYSDGAEHAFDNAIRALGGGILSALVVSPLFYYVARWRRSDAPASSSQVELS